MRSFGVSELIDVRGRGRERDKAGDEDKLVVINQFDWQLTNDGGVLVQFHHCLAIGSGLRAAATASKSFWLSPALSLSLSLGRRRRRT